MTEVRRNERYLPPADCLGARWTWPSPPAFASQTILNFRCGSAPSSGEDLFSHHFLRPSSYVSSKETQKPGTYHWRREAEAGKSGTQVILSYIKASIMGYIRTSQNKQKTQQQNKMKKKSKKKEKEVCLGWGVAEWQDKCLICGRPWQHTHTHTFVHESMQACTHHKGQKQFHLIFFLITRLNFE